MATKTDARFILFDANSLKKGAIDELEVFLKTNGFLQKDANGISVNVNDSSTSLLNLWTAQKTSNELALKATITYVDNAIAGLKWKNPIIDIIDQATLDGIISPSTGERYIINDGVNINQIAQYNGSSWDYTSPQENWTLMRESNDRGYTYDVDSTDSFKWVFAGIKQTESFIVEKFTLSGTDITNKKVTLTYAPTNANYVKLTVIGGCEQENTVDFGVNTSTKEVSWNGLGLEGVLAEGHKLVISYSKLG